MRNLIKIVILIAAATWAVSVVLHADLPGTWRELCRVTTSGERWLLLPLFLLPSALSQLLDTYGWRWSCGIARSRIGLLKLLGIRLAGEAVNQATPLLGMGGEPVKAVLVTAHAEAEGLASATGVTAAKLVMTVAQVIYVVVGVAAALLAVKHGGATLIALALFPLGVGALIVVLTASRLFLPARWRQAIAEHPRMARFQAPLRLLGEVLGFCRRRPGEFLAALVAFGVGWALPAGEFWLVGRAVGRPLSWSSALVMEALMNSITMATFFIPGNLGSQEAGLVYVTGLYGVSSPVGAIVVVLRRARELVWIGLGGACLAWLAGGGPRRAVPLVRRGQGRRDAVQGLGGEAR